MKPPSSLKGGLPEGPRNLPGLPAVRGDCQWGAFLGYDQGCTFEGNTCPTEVCRLMASFSQRLPLPRLVHFLDMILPQMVPVQSPCYSGRRRFASSYRVEERLARGEQRVENPLNVIKLFWSRSGIMHVAIAWDKKTTSASDHCIAPESYHRVFPNGGWPPMTRTDSGCVQAITVLIYFRRRVDHHQCDLIALAADLHTVYLANSHPARTSFAAPATCLEVWSGDHRQTPGGLTKKEKRIEIISEETHQAPPGPALLNSVYSST